MLPSSQHFPEYSLQGLGKNMHLDVDIVNVYQTKEMPHNVIVHLTHFKHIANINAHLLDSQDIIYCIKYCTDPCIRCWSYLKD